MDLPKATAALSSRSSPASPFPPLALSDFLSQQPFSSYDDDDDRVDIGPDTPPARDDTVSSRRSLSAKKPPHANPELLPPKSLATHQEKAIPSQPYDPLTVNWQSKRSQLLPSKNIGKKGDWIRSWSEAVGVYGAAAYCACSEPCSTTRTGDREFKSRIRNILQRKTLSKQREQQDTPSVETEPSLCHHCSRPSSPAVTLPAAKHDGKMQDESKKRKRDRLRALFSSGRPPASETGPSLLPGTPNPPAHTALASGGTTTTTTGTTGQGSSKGPRGDRFIKKTQELYKNWNLKDAARAAIPKN